MRRKALPAYCSEFADRHGKIRVRFRRKGYAAYYFKALPWTPAFMLEYRACLDGEAGTAIVPGADAIIPGSFNDLIARYYQTPAWKSVGDRTRTVYRGVIERFRVEHGHRLVADLTIDKATIIIGRMSATPSAANLARKLLRRLVRYAVRIEMRRDNPFDHTDPYKITSPGLHTWSEAEVAQFEARHPLGTKARLALALMLQTAQRRSDAVRMGRQHVRDGKLTVTQRKTGKLLALPLLPDLIDAIDACPADNMTFLVTAYGKPFTPAGFGGWFRKRCDEAGLPQCSAHGLRKAAMVRMAQAGWTQQEIKAWSGHSGDKEVSTYVRAAEQETLAQAGADKLARRKMANPDTGLDISDAKPLKRIG